jgi:signal transduction histidine kinase
MRNSLLSAALLLESAFERSTVGLAILGESEEILAANPAFASLLGYEPIDLAGVRLADLRGTGPRSELKTRSGEFIAARLTISPAMDHENGITGLLIAEDARAEQEAEVEREKLEARLRQGQKMEALGQLTGGIAHDFNNMLTVILANAELLSGALDSEHPGRNDLEELRAAARRGTAVVRKLLGFSRRERLVLQAVNIGRLVQELSKHLRQLLPPPIEFEVVAEESPDAQVDANALEQILLNLLSNARDAMPDGGRVTIRTTAAQLDAEDVRQNGFGVPGDYACMTVSDTGVGMDERTRARLFEPFFTTKPPGLGTGLGLAMVYGLVKQQGGFVMIESQPRAGTAVRIYFPIATAPAVEKAAVSEELPRGGHETILLVEDEEPVRRAARRVLERFGYKVIVASDGEEGLGFIRSHGSAIDLVITDVVMPRLGGRGLYEAARASGAEMKFLFASGYTARDVGATGEIEADLPFIHKPWTVAEFTHRVREILDQP